MVRHSRRSRRGGDKLDDIQKQLDSIQQEVNMLKSSSSASVSDESMMDTTPMMDTSAMMDTSDMMDTPVVKEVVIKSWVDDKNKKFKDGAGGRVTLSFSRLMSLIDSNISKGNTKKDWVTIKRELNDADSVDGVQDVINKYSISFSSNYVAGTRRRKRHGKRRTHRRH